MRIIEKLKARILTFMNKQAIKTLINVENYLNIQNFQKITVDITNKTLFSCCIKIRVHVGKCIDSCYWTKNYSTRVIGKHNDAMLWLFYNLSYIIQSQSDNEFLFTIQYDSSDYVESIEFIKKYKLVHQDKKEIKDFTSDIFGVEV